MSNEPTLGPSGIRFPLNMFLDSVLCGPDRISMRDAATIRMYSDQVAQICNDDIIAWSWTRACHTGIRFRLSPEPGYGQNLEYMCQKLNRRRLQTRPHASQLIPIDIYHASVNRIAISNDSEAGKREKLKTYHEGVKSAILQRRAAEIAVLNELIYDSKHKIIQPLVEPPERPKSINLYRAVGDQWRHREIWESYKRRDGAYDHVRVTQALDRIFDEIEDTFMTHISSRQVTGTKRQQEVEVSRDEKGPPGRPEPPADQGKSSSNAASKDSSTLDPPSKSAKGLPSTENRP